MPDLTLPMASRIWKSKENICD